MEDVIQRFRQLVEDYMADVYEYDEYVARRAQLLNALVKSQNQDVAGGAEPAEEEDGDTIKYGNRQEGGTGDDAPGPEEIDVTTPRTKEPPQSTPPTPQNVEGSGQGSNLKLIALAGVAVVAMLFLGFSFLGDGDAVDTQVKSGEKDVMPISYQQAAAGILDTSDWGEQELVDLDDAWLDLTEAQQRAASRKSSYKELVSRVRARAYQIAALPDAARDGSFDEILSIENLALNMGFIDVLPEMQGAGIAVSLAAENVSSIPENTAQSPDSQASAAESADDSRQAIDDSQGSTPKIGSGQLVQIDAGSAGVTEKDSIIVEASKPATPTEKAASVAPALPSSKPAPVVKKPTTRSSTAGNKRACSAEKLQTKRRSCYDLLKDGSRGPMMTVIPGGEFGSESTEETLEATVQIEAPIAVQVYETTLAQYLGFCESQGRECSLQTAAREAGLDESSPVTQVSYSDATAYAQWLSKYSGERYRLPTYTEAEYFTRGGTDSRTYTGELIDPAAARFNSDSPVSASETKYSFNTNPYRLYHTLGNVREWSQSEGETYWVTGGDYSASREKLESGYKEQVESANGDNRTGFRLVRELD